MWIIVRNAYKFPEQCLQIAYLEKSNCQSIEEQQEFEMW